MLAGRCDVGAHGALRGAGTGLLIPRGNGGSVAYVLRGRRGRPVSAGDTTREVHLGHYPAIRPS
jgi:hypothetical protein